MDKVSTFKERLKKAHKEEFDGNIQQCVICKKDGIIKYDHKSLCAKHFVQIENDECIKEYFRCEMRYPKEVQVEIKKQKKHIYEKFREFFDV